MNVLLDTHTFLWWTTNDSLLSEVARAIIADPLNRVFVSPASAWEIAIKCGTGKLILPEPPTTYVPSRLISNGFDPLPVIMDHVLATYHLPFHHRDPFDRLLIAQSIVEEIPILSVDAVFEDYPVRVLW